MKSTTTTADDDGEADRAPEVPESRRQRRVAAVILFVFGFLDVAVTLWFVIAISYRGGSGDRDEARAYFLLQLPHAATGLLALLLAFSNDNSMRRVCEFLFPLAIVLDVLGALIRLILFVECVFGDAPPACVESLTFYAVEGLTLVVMAAVVAFEFVGVLSLRHESPLRDVSSREARPTRNAFVIVGALDAVLSVALLLVLRFVPGVATPYFVLQLPHFATCFAAWVVYATPARLMLSWAALIFLAAFICDSVNTFVQFFAIYHCVVRRDDFECAHRLYEHVVPFFLLLMLAALSLWELTLAVVALSDVSRAWMSYAGLYSLRRRLAMENERTA